ncbi:MAG: glycosyltransferase [Dehalococcoidia bacterium]|nr:glycosyltransferase [Dehalococcoidia bacterium]
MFGGAVRHVLDLCSRLDRSSFQLTCICPPDGPLPSRLEEIGVKAKVIDLYQYASPGTWARVFSFLRQEKPDIIHAHGPNAFLYATFGRPFAGNPAVISTHHSLYLQGKMEQLSQKHLAAARTRVFAALERWASRRASSVIFVSDADRQEYCGPGPSTIQAVTIPNGIDLSRFTPSQDSSSYRRRWGLDLGAKIIGCVARLSPEKGLVYLLRSLPFILDSHPEAFLMVVGEGSQRSELEDLARDLGLSERVLFTGHSNEVPDLISTMDVVVLPSLWEGQPLTILEAWAMEKPVVATAVRGTQHLVENGKTGILVPPRDPQALASAVVELLDDPKRGLLLGKTGRHLVEDRFDLDRTCREVAELYFSLVGQHGQLHLSRGG